MNNFFINHMNRIIRRQVRQLATKLWVYTLRHRLGVQNFLAIEAILAGIVDREDPKITLEIPPRLSGRFYGYKSGRIPRQKYIDHVDSFPCLENTASIFQLSLWQVLSNPLVTQRVITRLLLELENPVFSRLFDNKPGCKIPLRRALRKQSQVLGLGHISSLDALAALLLLLRETELNKQWHLYIDIKWEIQNLICRLSTFKPFYYVADELN